MNSYAERVVGFIDILGFADLVRRADRDPGLRGQIMEALETVRSVSAPGGGDTDLRAQNFSDSLILSAINTADGFWHLLFSIDALAWNLLQLGVLIRGGVTIGGIHHDEAIVFGVGVNEAYRLESAVAKVPRIALGARAVRAATEYASDGEIWSEYRNARLLRDTDGVWHLNYLAILGIFNRQRPTADMMKHPYYEVGRSVRQIIQAKVDSTVEQPDIYRKVEWLARYWNLEVAAHPEEARGERLGPILLAGQEMRTTPLPFQAH
jgi:hypothetical protein